MNWKVLQKAETNDKILATPVLSLGTQQFILTCLQGLDLSEVDGVPPARGLVHVTLRRAGRDLEELY